MSADFRSPSLDVFSLIYFNSFCVGARSIRSSTHAIMIIAIIIIKRFIALFIADEQKEKEKICCRTAKLLN